MSGKLYGVGVGPGDPELMTLKAVRIIQEAEIVAIPGLEKETCISYQIAVQAVPSLAEKELLYLNMPMTKNKEELKRNHDEGAEKVMEQLKAGKTVAFLTLGDVTIYSTYLYIHRRVSEAGYETEIINGIPSFCAAAARLNIGLTETKEQMHIIPASYGIEEALALPGTKVLMKTGKKMDRVKQILKEQHAQVFMVENCGMKNEKVIRDVDAIDENAGYYSLLIVKEENNG